MMNRTEIKAAAVGLGGFLALYFLPVENLRLQNALLEAVYLAHWYAREHVLLCLVPAFLIAGAIGTFVSQGAVLRYLGRDAPRLVAYGVASVSGGLLAVCSCTVLPLFAGIYRMGAGLGPAAAFLYAGPAINVLAIILTARILGPEMGIARAVGAVGFSLVIGVCMHLLFRKEEEARAAAAMALPPPEARAVGWDVALVAALVGILVFANWGAPQEAEGIWAAVYGGKWVLAGSFLLALAALAARLARCAPGELREWLAASWGFAKQILPLLLGGVLVAGLLLGRVGHEGLIPSAWVEAALGGNGVGANLFAAVAGALMYFATLTEVPIVQGLIGAGMGKGPALALLLAGPALSLPNMLVIGSILGVRKTAAFVALVVAMAAASGMVYGTFFN
ncbi:permease [Oleispirillum naphthae]|uniref:permease n=1 Tax=Oleispirillum naphthae TaxID=2838853 RepID=UPI00308228E6